MVSDVYQAPLTRRTFDEMGTRIYSLPTLKTRLHYDDTIVLKFGQMTVRVFETAHWPEEVCPLAGVVVGPQMMRILGKSCSRTKIFQNPPLSLIVDSPFTRSS
ncbi:hypothetical protein AVEN_161693-1 [Araneus ventricosus]|uniref:Uncharacterized protein n=1 Tax=Araneus ventricosus TaxID=182803 RepID=A0A4Y2L6H0_ARAVE|nr:hypothetical protein AVEN_161693-1 [Araneus ventricosus]